jgi:hypothetical protein
LGPWLEVSQPHPGAAGVLGGLHSLSPCLRPSASARGSPSLVNGARLRTSSLRGSWVRIPPPALPAQPALTPSFFQPSAVPGYAAPWSDSAPNAVMRRRFYPARTNPSHRIKHALRRIGAEADAKIAGGFRDGCLAPRKGSRLIGWMFRRRSLLFCYLQRDSQSMGTIIR